MTTSGCRIVGNEDGQSRDGWIRRSITSPSRLEELAELYRSLGFEVRVEPLILEDIDEACTGCAGDLVDCRAIYTRTATVPREPHVPTRDP
jgi:hypothetical protein